MSTASSSKVLVIVPCGKRKIWSKIPSAKSVPAKDAYVSNYFRLCRRYAEQFSDTWVILSGKHGIIKPNSALHENYDTRLTPSHGFRRLLHRQLRGILSPRFTEVVSLCGAEYSRLLNTVLKHFGLAARTPLDGLRIGARQRLLKRSNQERSAL